MRGSLAYIFSGAFIWKQNLFAEKMYLRTEISCIGEIKGSENFYRLILSEIKLISYKSNNPAYLV